MVLGVSGLNALGTIMWDFFNLTMKSDDGKQIILKGLTPERLIYGGICKSILSSMNRGKGLWLQLLEK